MPPKSGIPLSSLLVVALFLVLVPAARAGDAESDGPDSSTLPITSNLNSTAPPQPTGPVGAWIGVAYGSYLQTYTAALQLRGQIDRLLDDPKEENLRIARHAYLETRRAYALTEVFRFADRRLNAWPIRQSFIESPTSQPAASQPSGAGDGAAGGFINNSKIPMTAEGLDHLMAGIKPPDTAWGFQAMEFLLWGPLAGSEPGGRTAADFTPHEPVKERRRAYLRLVADRLVADLRSLVQAWDADQANEAAALAGLPQSQAVHRVLAKLAKFAGTELAVRRIETVLAGSGTSSPISAFAGDANALLAADCRGLWDAYFGTVGSFQSAGLSALAQSKDPRLAQQIREQMIEVDAAARGLSMPMGVALASPKGSPSRQRLADLAVKLKREAALFQELSVALDAEPAASPVARQDKAP